MTQAADANRPPSDLGPMPLRRRMRTIDERVVRSPLASIAELAVRVADWPRYLPHYRYVRFRERHSDGGGLVEMSANRPFGVIKWPTWWLSEMAVLGPAACPRIRFRHVGGVTTGMDVEWSFTPGPHDGTHVRIEHVWDGPDWPVVGGMAAVGLIGPFFVHGIAARTLAGLAAVAEGRAERHAEGLLAHPS